MSSKDIAQIVRCSQRWVEKLIKHYNEEGPNGLFDKRKRNKREKLLNHELVQELEKALESRPSDGGLWAGPKVALWMSDKLGCPVVPQTGLALFGLFETTAQSGIALMFLPPHSPELQPAEKLWPLIREAIANCSFDSIEAVEDVTQELGIRGFYSRSSSSNGAHVEFLSSRLMSYLKC